MKGNTVIDPLSKTTSLHTKKGAFNSLSLVFTNNFSQIQKTSIAMLIIHTRVMIAPASH